MTVLRHLRISRVLAGTIVLPVLFGALVIWSLGDRPERADKVPAAVVNLDRPITTKQPDGKEQVVFGGRLLASGLTSPTKQTDTSLGWRLTDAADAEQGLEDGDYYAVITIPADFSKRMSSITGTDPVKAGVTLRTNDASSAVVGQASKQVTDIATTRLGQTITATYLQGVNEGSARLKGELGKAADGAGSLADGSRTLAGGADRLSGGADELAGGLDELSAGADRLADGNRRLARGTAQLSRGVHRYATGIRKLADSTGSLGRTQELASGARQLSQGVSDVSRLVQGWAQACQNPATRLANPQLCAATDEAAGQTGQLTSGAQRLADGAQQLADAAPRLDQAIQRGADGADRLDRGTARLAGGAGQLADGAARLADGADRAAGGADQLADGSARLASGSDRLAGGGDRLADGLGKGASAIKENAEDQPDVVSDPITSTSSSITPTPGNRTLLLPVVLAFALWLGGFVTYLVRQALPADRLRTASSGLRVALAGWVPGVAVGVVQAALVLVAAQLLGADVHSPVGVAAVAVLAVGVFAAVNQAFVALLGSRRGWIGSIAFAVLQFVSLGGLVPIDTAPQALQLLNGVLPVSRAADAFGLLALGGQAGSLTTDVVVLVLWGAAALAVSTVAARRAQKVDLDDLRDGELAGV